MRKELGREAQVGFLNLGLYRWTIRDYMDKSLDRRKLLGISNVEMSDERDTDSKGQL